MTPEGKVKQWCRRKDGAFDKWFPGHKRVSPRGGPFAANGVCDDILCWQGIFVAIEVKSADGSATALQLDFLREVQAAGGVAAVLKGKDEHKLLAIRNAVIRKIDELRRGPL